MLPLADIAGVAGRRPLLVGFSGGLDSTVLLHVLATSSDAAACGLRAIHVEHGLHPDAVHWAAQCASFCAALGVPLTLAKVDVQRDGGGLEAAARTARHRAFEEALRDDEVLVLAHHRDDQAETFLLRALRGSGIDGLGAMRCWRAFGRGWLWRPLLGTARSELHAYALQRQLRWIDDPGNADTAFDRNFLRLRVLPLLRERWPHADAAFARSAALSSEAAALLDDGDAAALASVRTDDPAALARDAVRRLAPALRARVLRRWLRALGLPPLPTQGVRTLCAEVLDARDDASATFAWEGAAVRAWRNLLHAGWQRPPLPADLEHAWTGEAPLTLADGSNLRLECASGFDAPVLVHARRGGERITLPGRTHSHALKHVLQSQGVPPWRRERLPLVSDSSGEVLAAGDLVYSARFDAWLRERGARLTWSDAD
jgi:tRNA(Ile)-lysidine synthase